ncbi:hypothetical protein [Kitasatospora sp. NPDC004272]
MREQAGRGEWFCARDWAWRLERQGLTDAALAVLAPYLATGWWTAAETAVELLEGRGRAEEAFALLRAAPDPDRNRRALGGYLVELGRIEEALAVLQC